MAEHRTHGPPAVRSDSRSKVQTVVSRLLRRAVPSRLLPGLLFMLAGDQSKLVRDKGYGRSLRLMLPLDEAGKPLPWVPYCLSSLLAERVRADITILEFGAGFSTLFFMTRAKRVTSIEHDPAWAAQLRGKINDRVEVVPAAPDAPQAYCAYLDETPERFDLVLVDGLHRVECVRRALPHVTARGVIILDDSERPSYDKALTLAASSGFRILHLEGHKPGSIGLHRSSIFYRDGNCLDI